MTKKTKKEKKVAKVMREYKKGELSIGKSDKKVKNRKQAIAIALREAGIKKKRSSHGRRKQKRPKPRDVYEQRWLC